MLLYTTVWQENAGWTAPLPTVLDSPGTLVLVFGGPDSPALRAALADLARCLPQSVTLGCSSAGEIAGDRIRDGTLAVVLARFDASTVRKVVLPAGDAGGAVETGRQIARLLAGPDLRAVIVLCDGLASNGSDLAAGLDAELPPDVEVSGGLAGDGDRFAATWVLGEEGPVTGRVTAVGLYGEVVTGQGCHGGWSAFGPERTITRAEGNVLYELDGKPALELYRTYLGDLATGLPATALRFPLAVSAPGDAGSAVVRTVLGVNEADQSMRFAGNVPEGHRARLMRTRSDSLVQSAGLAGARAARQFAESGRPLALAISCVGRRLVLGERAEEEIESVRDALPRDAVQVGFYAYGEIGRGRSGGPCGLHNQTMTVTLFDEVTA